MLRLTSLSEANDLARATFNGGDSERVDGGDAKTLCYFRKRVRGGNSRKAYQGPSTCDRFNDFLLEKRSRRRHCSRHYRDFCKGGERRSSDERLACELMQHA